MHTTHSIKDYIQVVNDGISKQFEAVGKFSIPLSRYVYAEESPPVAIHPMTGIHRCIYRR